MPGCPILVLSYEVWTSYDELDVSGYICMTNCYVFIIVLFYVAWLCMDLGVWVWGVRLLRRTNRVRAHAVRGRIRGHMRCQISPVQLKMLLQALSEICASITGNSISFINDFSPCAMTTRHAKKSCIGKCGNVYTFITDIVNIWRPYRKEIADVYPTRIS